MSLYKNRYKIESARLKNWDYSSNGCYFITICTKNRKHLFGNIMNNKMQLSEIGNIVLQEWEKSFDIRKELFCDCFVIMPDHIHGIVLIINHAVNNPMEKTHNLLSLRGNIPKSVSSFVAGFKSHATKLINEYRNTPGLPVWLPRFHDHIIRNNGELIRIRRYIQNNPLNWEKDDPF